MVSGGLEEAVEKRTRNFQDLVWKWPADNLGFELAVEITVPDTLKKQLPREKRFELFRYEIAIREESGTIRIDSERGLLMPCGRTDAAEQQILKFPDPPKVPGTILLGGGRPGSRTILSKSREGRDNFNIEVSKQAGKGWTIAISFGPARSTLGNLPESPDTFPVSTYVKRLLETGTQRLFLDSVRMRPVQSAGAAAGGVLLRRLESSPGDPQAAHGERDGLQGMAGPRSVRAPGDRGRSRRGAGRRSPLLSHASLLVGSGRPVVDGFRWNVAAARAHTAGVRSGPRQEST